jgi:hypothetical protein
MPESITKNNFIELIELLLLRGTEGHDMLVDYHDRKKWISSNKITVTFLDNADIILDSSSEKEGYYIRDKIDRTIKYICGRRGRYEYFVDGKVNSGDGISSHLDERAFHRDWWIGMMNEDSDVFVDNGIGGEDYECPYVIPCNSRDKIIVKERNNGAVELYDKETEQLKHVCNIGRRYEYYKKGEYTSNSAYGFTEKHDILIKLIPHKDKIWVPLFHTFDPKNNPYIVRKRDDGGVDLLSKEDGTLKYICNIGKRFYYHPYTEGRRYY